MTDLDKEKILKEAIAIYGETLQKTVACEEITKMIKEDLERMINEDDKHQ